MLLTSLGVSSPEAVQWILVSGGVIALMVVVGGLLVWYYRKRVLFSDHTSADAGWTFEDLRQMKEKGDLSEEEYQALRSALIGSFQKDSGAKQRSEPGPSGNQNSGF